MSRAPVFRHLDLIRWAMLLDVLLVAAFMANRWFDYPFGGHVARVLDVGEESSLATWYSSVKLMLVGGLLLVMARVLRLGRAPRGTWMLQLGLGGFVLVMSIDEIVMGHETLGVFMDHWLLPTGDRADSVWFRYSGIWVVALLPVAAGGLLATWRLARAWNDRPATLCLAAGLLVLLGGAGSDFLTSFTGEAGPLATLQLAFEELTEMLGASLLLGGAWRLLESRGLRLFAQDAGPLASRPARRFIVVQGAEPRGTQGATRPRLAPGRNAALAADEQADAVLEDVVNR